MTPIALPDDCVPDFSPVSADSDSANEAARDAIAVLTAPERTAAWALATGSKIKDAAEKAGMPVRTLYDLRRRPHFTAALQAASDLYAEMQGATVEAARAILAEESSTAARQIVTLASGARSEMVRLMASSKVLEAVGVAGGKVSQTNVQVNVSTDGHHRTAQDEARAAIERARARIQTTTDA